jgi:probable F420-dependent oxidoreductase
MPAIRFVAAVPATSDWPTLRAACRTAEAHGFDAFARPDHLLAEGALAPAGTPILECFTTIAGLVAETSRLRFVQTVACNSFRHPGLLAKMVATLDVMSGGRMELGLGAGWLAQEYAAYGFDFPPASVRLAQLREALQVVKALWTGAPVDYEGAHYRLRGALCLPKPVQRPPILVGGGGAGLLAIAAAEADVVNIVPPTTHGTADAETARRFTLDRFRRKADRVRELAAGREVAISAMMFVQQTGDDAGTNAALDAIAVRYRLAREEAERFPLVIAGTAAALCQRIAERIALLGLAHVVLHFPSVDALDRFGAEVLPALRT